MTPEYLQPLLCPVSLVSVYPFQVLSSSCNSVSCTLYTVVSPVVEKAQLWG